MTKYDWDAWFDGDVWELKRGEDYDDALRNRSVQAAIESAAVRRGLQVVSTNVDKNTVRLQVTGKLEQKTVPEGYTGLRCRVCGGPIQNNNKVGICRRNGACRRERDRLRSGRVTGYKEKNELTFRMKMLNTARGRAKKYGIPFALTINDIPEIPERCPVFGISLDIWQSREEYRASTPSLDKIDPSLGYVPGNVWIISMRANQIKSDATLAELEQVVEALRRYHGNGQDRLPH